MCCLSNGCFSLLASPLHLSGRLLHKHTAISSSPFRALPSGKAVSSAGGQVSSEDGSVAWAGLS